MFRQLGLLGAALALFSLAGGQWAVLQGVAWTGMLWQHAQSDRSLVVAVAQTFDGQHPCELCRSIVAAKSKERPGSPTVPSVKKEVPAKALLGESLPALEPLLSNRPTSFPVRVFFTISRLEAPPTPPPRGGVTFAA